MKFKIDELEEIYVKYTGATLTTHTMNSLMLDLRQLEEKYDYRFSINPAPLSYESELSFHMSFKTPADRNWFALKWGVNE